MSEPRCPWAIHFGITLHTRCARPVGHEGLHEGPGLAEFPNQRVKWLTGDRRAYQTERDEPHAWERSGG